MTAFIILLCMLVFSGNLGASTDCESHGYYASVHYDISEKYTLTFTCSTNLPANYPRWEINSYKYEVSDLPPHINATGLSIQFTLESSVDVRCFIKTFQNGSVVDVSSEKAMVKRAGNQGSSFSERLKENATFTNLLEVSFMHVGIDVDNADCKKSLTLSRCDNPDIEKEYSLKVSNELGIKFEIESVNLFYGHDIMATMIYNCSDYIFYIPNMKQTEYKFIKSNYVGPIINDLSNDYGCDVGNPVIDYKICIRAGDSNNCFESPCGNGKIFTSLCHESFTTSGSVSLEVNGAENGTVVSIFCQSNDCRGRPSNVMLFNIEIVICEDCNTNAECIMGKCVCKNGYIGNGTSCLQKKGTDSRSSIHVTRLVSLAVAGVVVVMIVIVSVIVVICLFRIKCLRNKCCSYIKTELAIRRKRKEIKERPEKQQKEAQGSQGGKQEPVKDK